MYYIPFVLYSLSTFSAICCHSNMADEDDLPSAIPALLNMTSVDQPSGKNNAWGRYKTAGYAWANKSDAAIRKSSRNALPSQNGWVWGLLRGSKNDRKAQSRLKNHAKHEGKGFTQLICLNAACQGNGVQFVNIKCCLDICPPFLPQTGLGSTHSGRVLHQRTVEEFVNGACLCWVK